MTAPRKQTDRQRLDELLVARGLYQSRSRARDAIARSAVRVDGAVVAKPGLGVSTDADVEIDDPAQNYVSRAALKLITGLDHFRINPSGACALDVGASTGGFTEVLLERGAARVFAIDVGHGQMAEQLASDPRVTSIEGLNARDLTLGNLQGMHPDFLVCDVSFISLKLALPPALDLAAPGTSAVLLVKPQFEAGREAVGKGGILKGTVRGEAIADDMRRWLDAWPNWRALGVCASPVAGGDGNREFLLAGIKDR